eukprot:COSAG03_NODE_15083_length_441_cov_1.292398_1_plen_83_part_10
MFPFPAADLYLRQSITSLYRMTAKIRGGIHTWPSCGCSNGVQSCQKEPAGRVFSHQLMISSTSNQGVGKGGEERERERERERQ